MIQKQNKHIVTYHSGLSFCYGNDTEKTKHIVTCNSRLNFCYGNDTETKHTHSYLP